MRIERISRETHPEKCELLDKMAECRGRGHGTLVIDPDGFVECYDCGELLDSLLEPDYVDWEDPDSDGADTPERDD